MRYCAALVFALVSSLGCAGDPAPQPSGADAAVGPDATVLPFMAECPLGQNAACASDLCFDFNSKGPHCTHGCTVDTDCEAPSPGCSGMGVCKAPGGGGGTGSGSGSGSGSGG
ncbi:MAG: hypothetical protein K8W52_45475 [Deltaproteobacteria bacterium]|nr:hypothetical protein [Deltaproteobacteria bacterium]